VTKQNLIRVLSGMMFLIFFCPFFQMCSDDGLLHKISDDKTEKTEREKDTIVLNAYELSVFNSSDKIISGGLNYYLPG